MELVSQEKTKTEFVVYVQIFCRERTQPFILLLHTFVRNTVQQLGLLHLHKMS
jgi:hypothetical protein